MRDAKSRCLRSRQSSRDLAQLFRALQLLYRLSPIPSSSLPYQCPTELLQATHKAGTRPRSTAPKAALERRSRVRPLASNHH